MSLSSIKHEMLLPDRELVIGKSFEVQGIKALILSITEQDGQVKLWVLMQCPVLHFVKLCGGEYATNRDEILGRTANSQHQPHLSEIEIHGVKLSTSGSSSRPVAHDPMSYMKLQHFYEKGIDLSPIEDILLDELVLTEYQLAEGMPFPEIDLDLGMPVTLRTADEHREVLVASALRFRLAVGESSNKEAYSFRDEEGNRDILFYIDRLTRYDIWKEAEDRFENEAVLSAWRENGLDDDAIAQARKSFEESMESICPKGQELLVIQYESPDDVQLNFYSNEHLDSKPKSDGPTAVGLIFGSDEEQSVHGYRVHTCLLKTVPRGFDGLTEVELVSWYRKIPGEQCEPCS